MKLKINLSSYSLAYLFGDRVFQDSFLLSREVLKKAYQEKIYYISSENNVDELLSHPENFREILVFAGIPSFAEVCTDLSPNSVLYAVKISLNYEVLANFERVNSFLENTVDFESMEKVNLYLSSNNGKLFYQEQQVNSHLEEEREKIEKNFLEEIKTYRYAIQKELEYLDSRVTKFLESSKSKEVLEDEQVLQILKEIYEMLIFLEY